MSFVRVGCTRTGDNSDFKPGFRIAARRYLCRIARTQFQIARERNVVKLSRRENLPELLSPTTTSCRKIRSQQGRNSLIEAYLWKWNMLANILLTQLVYFRQESWARPIGFVSHGRDHRMQSWVTKADSGTLLHRSRFCVWYRARSKSSLCP